MRVHPPFRSRKEAELRIERARILEIGLRSARGRGGGTDFDQLREYGPDDDHRRIDWAATARSQRVIVRTFRAERNQTLVLLLDNGRVMAGRVAGVPRLEHAMDAILCVTTVATRLGDKCGLVAFDHRVRAVVPPSSGRDQVSRITESMFDLEPELVESDYRGAFTTTLARFRRRSMLIVLSDLVEQAVGESLLPALPMVSRRHLVVVAAVADPDAARLGDRSRARRRGGLPQGGCRRRARGQGSCRGVAPGARRDRRRRPARTARAQAHRRLPRGEGHREALGDGFRARQRSHAAASSAGCPVKPASAATRPRPTIHATKSSSTATPTATRTPVGSGAGVTKPSMIPADDERQCRAEHQHDRTATLLGERRRPGAIAGREHRPARPQAGTAGDGDRGELEQAVGEDQPEELAALALGDEQPGGHPRR